MNRWIGAGNPPDGGNGFTLFARRHGVFRYVTDHHVAGAYIFQVAYVHCEVFAVPGQLKLGGVDRTRWDKVPAPIILTWP